MTQPVYDEIGRSYRSTRRADPRIVAELARLIGCESGATVCDVGAGSGNYTNALADAGFSLLAVEPSEIMRRQARPETYLEPAFQANTSAFATMDRALLTRRLERLAEDLASGRWDARFGNFRMKASNDAGLVFVTLRR